MSGLVLQSRFAGLMIEDDDYSASSSSNKKKAKQNSAKKAEPKKTTNNKAKPNPAPTQTAPKKKKSKPRATTAEQWELWKQKDEELVDGNFESELQQAILLSKLDFEEKKDVYKVSKKEAEQEKKNGEQPAKKKQKKKTVMSLDQLQEMVDENNKIKMNHEDEIPAEAPKSPDKDTEFFDRIKDETKNEILKDKIIDRVKNRQASDEIITRIQYIEALEKKDKEIESLREEVVRLKQELLTVKGRNKKLCGILGQGEMRDKAEVLMEVERLRSVQSELTHELQALHERLERERSRHHHPDPRARDKKHSTKKKNIRFDVSSEALMAKESGTSTA